MLAPETLICIDWSAPRDLSHPGHPRKAELFFTFSPQKLWGEAVIIRHSRVQFVNVTTVK